MNFIKKILENYLNLVKKFVTFLGTAVIYFTAIPLGFILHLFTKRPSANHWSNYQNQLRPSKMY